MHGLQYSKLVKLIPFLIQMEYYALTTATVNYRVSNENATGQFCVTAS